MTEMNPAIKARWTAALRSGKYEQGAFKLNSQGKFCCLGVLCEIAREAGVVEAVHYGNGISYAPVDVDHYINASDYEDTILPRAVSAWAGLETGSPSVFVDADRTKLQPLTILNDNGKPFAEIANLIEGSL